MIFNRQEDGKSSKLPGVAIDSNLPAVILDNAVTHRKPQPGSFPDIFGSKKGVKYLTEVLRGYTRAVVFEFNAQLALPTVCTAAAGNCGADFDCAASLQSV